MIIQDNSLNIGKVTGPVGNIGHQNFNPVQRVVITGTRKTPKTVEIPETDSQSELKLPIPQPQVIERRELREETDPFNIELNRLLTVTHDMSDALLTEEPQKKFDKAFSKFVLLTASIFHPEIPGSLLDRMKNEERFNGLDLETINNTLLEEMFEKLVPHIEENLINYFKMHGEIDPLRVKTIVAPQGAGKGININAIQNTLEALRGQTIESEELKELLKVINNMNVTTTGTKGIFNPLGDPRYALYSQLGDVCGPIVNKGVLLSDSLTHALVLIEMTRQAIKGDTNNMVDTYPRTKVQYQLFLDFMAKLRSETGKDHASYYVMLDLLSDEDIEFIMEHPELAEETAVELAQDLKEKMKEIPDFGKMEVPQGGDLEEQKSQALEMFDKLKSILEDMKSYEHARRAQIKTVQIEDLQAIITRMGRRVSTVEKVEDIRKDERSAKSIFTRLIDTMKLTMPIALSFAGIKIISAANPPEVVNRNLLLDICRVHGINPEDEEVALFIENSGRNAHEIVYGKGE